METEQCRAPSGVRSLMPVRRAVSRLCGSEPACVSKREALAAVRAAAEALGLDAVDRQMIDAFAALTPADDWERGEPFVSARNRTIMARAGIGSERTVSRRLARLERLGLVLRRMSGNGQRRIQRLRDDRILVAWGIDLSPMQKRRGEFLTLAREHGEAFQRLRAEAQTITARRREAQEAVAALREMEAFETAAAIEADLAALFPNHLRRSREIERLEADRRSALAGEAEALLERALAAFDAVHERDAAALRGENLSDAADAGVRRLTRSESPTYCSNERRCADAQHVDLPKDAASGGNSEKGRDARGGRPLRAIALPVLKAACPGFLEAFGGLPLADWNDLFRAAEMARRQLKVDDRLWERACKALGHRRDLLAALVGYVWERRYSGEDAFRLARPDAVGGYYRRCVEAAEANALNLDVSIYAMASRARTNAARPADEG